MINKLKLKDKSAWATDEGYLAGPAVISARAENSMTMAKAIYGLHVEDVDGVPHVGAATIEGVRYYPINGADDVNVNESRGDITFSSYGTIYTVRAFQDTDGKWASRLRAIVPAEALEEMYMTEVKLAFSPNAPAQDDDLYAAVDEETSEVKYLVYTSTAGMFIRSSASWFKLPKDDESLDGLEVYEVAPKFIAVFDKAERGSKTLTSEDADQYASDGKESMTAAAERGDPSCPPATQDLIVNLENRERAIQNAGYGPLNPNEPNDEFWDEKGSRWGVSGDEARKSTCGNCVMFIRTPTMLNCIATGLEMGESPTENAWDAIDAAELGYCEGLDFKCAASRTCSAWVVGGPITEEEEQEN
jgi:hypothetical protein